MSGARPRLTRRLALEAKVTVPDGAGGLEATWTTLGELWAEVSPRSGGLVGEDGASVSRMGLKITVRAAPPGTPQRPLPGQVFREGPRRFRIDAVTERDAEGRFLLCYAVEEEVAR